MWFMTQKLGFSYMCSGLNILASVLKNKTSQWGSVNNDQYEQHHTDAI